MPNIRLGSGPRDRGQVLLVKSYEDLQKQHPEKFATELKNPKKVKNLSRVEFEKIVDATVKAPAVELPVDLSDKNTPKEVSTNSAQEGRIEGTSVRNQGDQESFSATASETIRMPVIVESSRKESKHGPPAAHQVSPQILDAIATQYQSLEKLAESFIKALDSTIEQNRAVSEQVVQKVGDLLRNPILEEFAKTTIENGARELAEQVKLQAGELDVLRGKVNKELVLLKTLGEDVREDTQDLQRMVEKYRPGAVQLLEQKLQTLQCELDAVLKQRNELQLRLATQELKAGAYDPELYQRTLRENVELRKNHESFEETKRQLSTALRQVADLEPYRKEAETFHGEQRELADLRKFHDEYALVMQELQDEEKRLQETTRRQIATIRRLTGELSELKVDKANIDVIMAELKSLREGNKTLRTSDTLKASQIAELQQKCDGLILSLDEGEALFRRQYESEQRMHIQRLESETRTALENDFKSEKEQLNKKVRTAESDRSKLETRADDLARMLDEEMARSIELRDKYAALMVETAPEKLEGSIAELKHERNVLLDQKNEIGKELNQLRKEEAELSGRLAALKAERQREEDYQQRNEQMRAKRDAMVFEPWTRQCSARDVKEESKWLNQIIVGINESGFHISKRLLLAFHTSLKAQDISPLTLLMGISGTGKSELPRLYADYGGLYFLPVTVQPNWDSPMDLFGFYNYADGYFRGTTLSQAMLQFVSPEAQESLSDRVLLVLLDEMNLARVEHYFSELLSRLEARRGVLSQEHPTIDQKLRASVELDLGRRKVPLFLDRNVLFTGTLNQDESTLELSDKVVDRSNVITFPRPDKFASGCKLKSSACDEGKLPRGRWEEWCRPDPKRGEGILGGLESEFKKINQALSHVNRGVGQRVFQAVHSYIMLYPAVSKEICNVPQEAAREDQYAMKILPKLKGIDLTSAGGKKCIEQLREVLPAGLKAAFDHSCRGREIFEWEGSTELFSESQI